MNRLKTLYDIDQKAIEDFFGGKMERTEVREIQQRCVKVAVKLYESGRLNTVEGFYYAAMIMQHGKCTENYRRANGAARKALELGGEDDKLVKEIKWIVAASEDRLLESLGKPQKYGTQFVKYGEDGEWELPPIDPTVTDEERAALNVPPLSEIIECVRKRNEEERKKKGQS